MSDDLGQAIFEIVAKFTGGDASLAQIKSFFDEITTQVNSASKNLIGLEATIKEISKAFPESNSIAKGIKGITKATREASIAIEETKNDLLDLIEVQNRTPEIDLINKSNDLSRDDLVGQDLKGIKDLDDLVKRGEKLQAQEKKRFEDSKKGVDNLAKIKKKADKEEGERIEKNKKLFLSGLREQQQAFRKSKRDQAKTSLQKEFGSEVTDLDSFVDFREEQITSAKKGRQQQRQLQAKVKADYDSDIEDAIRQGNELTAATEKQAKEEIAAKKKKRQENRQLTAQAKKDRDQLIQDAIDEGNKLTAARKEKGNKGRDIALGINRQGLNQYEDGLDKVNSAEKQGIITTRQATIAKRNLRKELAASTFSHKVYGSAVFKQSQILRDFGFQLADVGRQFMFFGVAVIGALTGIVIQYAKFQQATQNVIAVLSELDNAAARQAGFDILSAKFLKIGEDTEFTAVQIAQAARELGLAGLSLIEINDSITDIVSLASAGNVSLQDAAKIAVNLGRAFQIDASGFDRIADVLATVATNSNTTVETLGESFKLLAPIASNLGQPLEEVTASLGVLGNAGVSASRAGTGLSRAFSELLEKSKDFDLVLKSVGSSFEKIDPTKVGLADIIAEFEKLQNTAGFSTKNFFDLFDQRSARVITTLVNQGSTALEDLTEKANNSARAAERIAAVRLDTVEGNFRKTLSALQTSLITLGSTLQEVATDVLATVKGIIQFGTTLTNRFGPQITGLLKFVAGLGLEFIVLGGILSGIGLILRGLAVKQLAGLITAFLTTDITLKSLTTSLVSFRTTLISVQLSSAVLIGVLVAVAAALAVVAINSVSSAKSLEVFSKTVANTKKSTDELVGTFRELQKQFDLFRNLPNLNSLQFDLLGADGDLTQERLAESGERILRTIDLLRGKITQEFLKLDQDNLRNSPEITGITDSLDRFLGIDYRLGFTVDVDFDPLTNSLNVTREQVGGKLKTTKADLSLLPVPIREAVVELALLEKKLNQVFSLKERTETFDKAFLGGREGTEQAIEELEARLLTANKNIDKATLALDIDSTDSSAKGELKVQQQIAAILIKDRDTLRSNLELTDEQLQSVKEIRQVQLKRAEIANDTNLDEETKKKLIKDQTVLLKGLIAQRNEEAATIKEATKAENARNAALAERAKRLDELIKKDKERGKSALQIERDKIEAEINEFKDSVKVSPTDDIDSSVEDKLSAIKKNEDEITRQKLKLEKAKGKLSEEDFKKAEIVIEDIIAGKVAANDALRKGITEIQKESSQAIDILGRDLQDVDNQIASEKKENEDERSLVIQRLELAQAQRNKDLKKELELTKLITEAENKEEADKFDDPDKKAKFIKLKALELKATLKEIQDKGAEGDKKAQQQVDKAAKKREDQAKKAKDVQEKTRQALLGQVKSLRDSILLVKFLNRQESNRFKTQQNLVKSSATLQRQLRQADASGDQRRIDRTRNRAGFLLDRGNAFGLNLAQEGLRNQFNGNQPINQPGGPLPVPLVGSTVNNITIEQGAIQINAESANAEEIGEIVEEKIFNILDGVDTN